MSQRPSLAAFAILAAAAALPAHALIPLASDVVQGILDSRKSGAQEIASPGVAPDPDPLEKYRGLSIKPTANELAAHDAWVKRQAALSEAPDTLFERMSDAKTTGAAGLGLAVKEGPARLSQGQFYAFNANGTAQLYTGTGAAVKTSASGLRALYQTLSEQDRALAAHGGLAAAAGAEATAAANEGSDEPAPARAGAASATDSKPSAESASAAAQSILGAFGALSGSAAPAPAAGQAALPGSAIAGGAAASAAGAAGRPGAGATRRLEGFGKGNAGGPSAAALSREGDMPTVKVKGMEDLFNGGSEALKKK